MRRYTGIETLDEAVKQAKEILSRNKRETTITTKTTRPSRDLLDVVHNKPEEEPLYVLLREERTGEAAYVYKVVSSYSVYYFEPEEWDSRTLPYRNVKEMELIFLCLFATTFIKPKRLVAPEDALSMDGAETIYSLFGSSYKEDYGAEALEKRGGEYFRYFYDNERPEGVEPEEEDEDVYIEPLEIAPSLLEERTGVRITSAKSYARAYSTLVGRKLSKKEELSVGRSYEFHVRDLYLHYVLYEFLREESYSALKAALSSFKLFNLPKEWYRDFYPANEVKDVEEFIVSRYLSVDALQHFGDVDLREISTKTGLPYSLVLKAYRHKNTIWQI